MTLAWLAQYWRKLRFAVVAALTFYVLFWVSSSEMIQKLEDILSSGYLHQKWSRSWRSGVKLPIKSLNQTSVPENDNFLSGLDCAFSWPQGGQCSSSITFACSQEHFLVESCSTFMHNIVWCDIDLLSQYWKKLCSTPVTVLTFFVDLKH